MKEVEREKEGECSEGGREGERGSVVKKEEKERWRMVGRME